MTENTEFLLMILFGSFAVALFSYVIAGEIVDAWRRRP
jgi:putative holin-like toxin